MNKNVFKSMMVLFVAAVIGLTGCGGGGGGGDNNSTPQKKTSVVDGTWSTSSESFNFNDGKVEQTTHLPSVTSWKSGTFTVSGNILDLHYTSSTYDTATLGQSIQQIINNPTSHTSPINETVEIPFSISGNNLTLTVKNALGNVGNLTYTKN
jgi:hypothetical protein